MDQDRSAVTRSVLSCEHVTLFEKVVQLLYKRKKADFFKSAFLRQLKDLVINLSVLVELYRIELATS